MMLQAPSVSDAFSLSRQPSYQLPPLSPHEVAIKALSDALSPASALAFSNAVLASLPGNVVAYSNGAFNPSAQPGDRSGSATPRGSTLAGMPTGQGANGFEGLGLGNGNGLDGARLPPLQRTLSMQRNFSHIVPRLNLAALATPTPAAAPQPAPRNGPPAPPLLQRVTSPPPLPPAPSFALNLSPAPVPARPSAAAAGSQARSPAGATSPALSAASSGWSVPPLSLHAAAATPAAGAAAPAHSAPATPAMPSYTPPAAPPTPYLPLAAATPSMGESGGAPPPLMALAAAAFTPAPHASGRRSRPDLEVEPSPYSTTYQAAFSASASGSVAGTPCSPVSPVGGGSLAAAVAMSLGCVICIASYLERLGNQTCSCRAAQTRVIRCTAPFAAHRAMFFVPPNLSKNANGAVVCTQASCHVTIRLQRRSSHGSGAGRRQAVLFRPAVGRQRRSIRRRSRRQPHWCQRHARCSAGGGA